MIITLFLFDPRYSAKRKKVDIDEHLLLEPQKRGTANRKTLDDNIVRWKSLKKTLHIVWKLLKMSHLIFSILAIFTNYCLGTMFDRKLQFLKNRQNGIFKEFLSTQNVARNVEWDFFSDFQTLWSPVALENYIYFLSKFGLRKIWPQFFFCSQPWNSNSYRSISIAKSSIFNGFLKQLSCIRNWIDLKCFCWKVQHEL